MSPSSALPPRARHLGAALTLLTTLAAPALSGEQPGRDKIVLKFVNVEIDALAQTLGDILGKTFVLDPRVKGKVTVFTAKPVSRNAAYDTFLSSLRLQGIAAVESGGIVKIVPEADAKQHPGALLQGAQGARGEQVVTRVFELKYESAQQLATQIKPLVSANNTLIAHPGSNALIVTDYASNLARLEQIIRTLDRPAEDQPRVERLAHASAIEVASAINKILGEGGGAASAGGAAESVNRLVAVADARSNSVILRSGSAARLERARQLIRELDTAPRTGPSIRVIPLRYADASKISTVLRAVVTGVGAEAPTTGAGGQAAPAAAGSVLLQADVTNNAIVLNAPDAIYNAVRAAIEQLDTRRPQVFIEALLVEVTADKVAEFGVQWQVLSGLNETNLQGVGGTNFGAPGLGRNILDAAKNLGGLGPGLNVGVVKGTVNIPGFGRITNLGLLARALESDAKANILSTPTLLTLDNEEAKIVIGQNVPFITGQYAQTGSNNTPSPFQTIERRDVGITLRVRPQIMQDGSVRLAIYQEASTVQDKSNVSGIITNKRTIESTVLVDNGQIVALGGLMQDQVSNGADQVPGLGALPLIGNLFRYESRKRNKTNLMVFLRPRILREGESAQALTQPRYDAMDESARQGDLPARLGLPGMQGPRLPAFPRASIGAHGRQ